MISLKTKDFSNEVIEAAANNARGREIKKKHTKIISAIGFGIGYLSTRDFFGNPLYHLSGPITYAAGRVADRYSTYKVAKLFEDPRFRDYGFDSEWYESNSLFPSHPSRKDLSNKKAAVLEIVLGVGTAITPFAGYGLGIGGFLSHENNRAIHDQIKKGFEIGNQVEKMISVGSTEEDIRKYLSSLIKRG